MQVPRKSRPDAVDEQATGYHASRDLADAMLACAQTLVDLVPSLMDEVRQHMRAAAPATISVPQMRLLIYARRHGGASLTAVAEHLGVTLPTVSVAAQRLVESGFLENHPDPQDRRRSAISLTPAGVAVVQSARKRTRANVAARLQHADADTLQTIQAGLLALAKTMHAFDTPQEPLPAEPGRHAPEVLTVSPRARTATQPSRPVAQPTS